MNICLHETLRIRNFLLQLVDANDYTLDLRTCNHFIDQQLLSLITFHDIPFDISIYYQEFDHRIATTNVFCSVTLLALHLMQVRLRKKYNVVYENTYCVLKFGIDIML